MSKARDLKKVRDNNGLGIRTREFIIDNKEETIQSYYENILSAEEINKSVEEYRVNMDIVSKEFKERTKLQDKDIAFLTVATMLQCARIYLVNYFTKMEKAGSGNKKEAFLHEKQEKILGKFGFEENEHGRLYYAPLKQIVLGRGVPYDATAYFSENYKLFEGANHRFSTLGHDPLFGLIFGTTNILTNTITCNQKIVLKTNHVIYDENMKNPKISRYASTPKMFESVKDRIINEKEAVVAAVIKQLIHIGTDLYTPCGIQLPGASLILDKANVEKLTKYVSTGDVIKFGASAAIDCLINMIIRIVHSCKWLYEEDGDFSKELYEIRTRKIILYSNLFATSSNVIYTGLTGNMKDFDFAGFAITAYRLFSDTNFTDKIKYEFLNSQVSKVYEEKLGEDSLYY